MKGATYGWSRHSCTLIRCVYKLINFRESFYLFSFFLYVPVTANGKWNIIDQVCKYIDTKRKKNLKLKQSDQKFGFSFPRSCQVCFLLKFSNANEMEISLENMILRSTCAEFLVISILRPWEKSHRNLSFFMFSSSLLYSSLALVQDEIADFSFPSLEKVRWWFWSCSTNCSLLKKEFWKQTRSALLMHDGRSKKSSDPWFTYFFWLLYRTPGYILVFYCLADCEKCTYFITLHFLKQVYNLDWQYKATESNNLLQLEYILWSTLLWDLSNYLLWNGIVILSNSN